MPIKGKRWRESESERVPWCTREFSSCHFFPQMPKRRAPKTYTTPSKRARKSRGSNVSALSRVKKTIIGMAENKRAYLTSYNTYNHDAGFTAVVGNWAHPASAIGNNWLGTSQGDSAWQREGDAIFSKYLDYTFYLESVDDRMCSQCRILIVRGTGNNANDYNSSNIADWFVTDGPSAGSGALISQPVDTRKYTVLKDIIVCPLSSTAGGISVSAPATQGNVVAQFPVIRGRLKTGYKVHYKTGTEYPTKSSQRIQMAIIPWNGEGVGVDNNVLHCRVELLHHFCDF